MSLNPEIVFKSFQNAIQLKPSIGKLEVILVHCVLHKAIEKLLMIKELLQGPEKTHPSGSGYFSLAIRMKQRDKLVPPTARLPDNMLLAQQIKRQITFLLDLFEETVIELDFQGSQVYLEYSLLCENLKLFDNLMIKTENKDYNTLINYLQEEINYCKQNNHITQQCLLESTGPCLDKAVVNVYAEEHLGAKYAYNVEQTRIKQNVLKCKVNERAVQQLNEKLHCEMEEEHLVHDEVNSHIALLLTELTNKLEYWTHKYNTEIDQLDIDLLQMKSKKDEQTMTLDILQNQFLEKKEILEALQEEQQAREREAEKKLLDNKAAEKIQRWWRNIQFKQRLLNKQFRRKSSIKKQTRGPTKKNKKSKK